MKSLCLKSDRHAPRRLVYVTLALCVSPALACSSSAGQTATDTNSAPTSATISTSASTSATAGGSASETGDASTSAGPTSDPSTTDVTTGVGPKLDVAPDVDFGGGETDGGDGCKKIDFLFVIDNSNSMANEQQLLIDAFPGFIAAIESGLPQATDYHIGVTKSDIHGFDDDPDPDPQNPCPYLLGGLLDTSTPPDAKTGTGASCGFSSGAQYMTSGPALADEFACVAEVGIKGNTGEYQAGATLAALSDSLAQPGACNEGFLREDALLVLTLITDEDDDWSEPDSAQVWYDGVVAAKGDIESNVVFLLISGGSPKWPSCPPLNLDDNSGAAESQKLTSWAQMFTNHELGNVCESGYEDYLANAIATIETACDEFQPPE